MTTLSQEKSSTSSLDLHPISIIYKGTAAEPDGTAMVEATTYVVAGGVAKVIHHEVSGWGRIVKDTLSKLSSSSAGFSADELVIAVDNEEHPLPHAATRVRALYGQSGLTWNQVARMFGVSRRSVHAWARGGRMNARNSERLATIESAVEANRRESPSATREALLNASNGPSVFQRLTSNARAQADHKDDVHRLLASTAGGASARGADTSFENVDWPATSGDEY